mmetsp:Transcript_87509/g.245745  ORF Transcript_87509/g.245745 Transcript_87509/m.245745 type:complete len:312 (-) Transcript_87509:128-1063(-)
MRGLSAGRSASRTASRTASRASSRMRSQGLDDEGDTLSLVSRGLRAGSAHPLVSGLRDRLVQEARNERQRVLEAADAAEHRRAELRGICSVSSQTDPIFVMGGPGDLPDVSSPAIRSVWSAADEAEHQEALRTIQLLSACSSHSQAAECEVAQLEERLQAVRVARAKAEVALNYERSRKEAAQQQVMCLENELDSKEVALQVAERALENRDADLQQVGAELQQLHSGLVRGFAPATTMVAGAHLERLRAEVADRERQIHQKDEHIARLTQLLRQPRIGIGAQEAPAVRVGVKNFAVHPAVGAPAIVGTYRR